MRLINADEIKIRLPFILPPYNMMLLRNSITQGIQDTPTVDAELVRHRHWRNMGEHKDDDGNTWGEIYCSGCEMGFIGMGTIDTEALHYCPNCGRKMDEEADDE